MVTQNADFSSEPRPVEKGRELFCLSVAAHGRFSSMKTFSRLRSFWLPALLLAPASAFAHHAQWMQDRPFVQGLSMPVHGLDHMMVTLGVGLLSVQLAGKNKRALWAVPASFAALLLAGGIVNICGVAVPFLEQGILASVVLMGAMLALKPQWPLAAGMAVVAGFAAYHGVALVGEGPHNLWFALFAFGCLLAAAVVLGCGMLLGLLLQKTAHQKVIRYAGAVMIAMAAVITVFPKVNDVIIQFLE